MARRQGKCHQDINYLIAPVTPAIITPNKITEVTKEAPILTSVN